MLLTVCGASFPKLQIHIHVCHSIVATTWTLHEPDGTFFHSAVHSSVTSSHSPCAFPPCPVPSHVSHLIPLMEVFPLAQDQVVLPVRPRPRSGVAPPELWPLMFSGSNCLTQMFSFSTFVFSLQTRLFFAKFTQVFLQVINLACEMRLESHLTPVLQEEAAKSGRLLFLVPLGFREMLCNVGPCVYRDLYD